MRLSGQDELSLLCPPADMIRPLHNADHGHVGLLYQHSGQPLSLVIIQGPVRVDMAHRFHGRHDEIVMIC